MADHTLCRLLLAQVMPWVNKVTTPAVRKACWAYIFDGFNRQVEWHGPDGFYWHGSGCCKYLARYYGWMAWLEAKHPALYAEMDKEGEDNG
jgi:hypothetical protein